MKSLESRKLAEVIFYKCVGGGRHLAQACFFSVETVIVEKYVYGFFPAGIPHPPANLTHKLSPRCFEVILMIDTKTTCDA